MSVLLEHSWGESAFVDRVWAQVVGLRSAESDGRLLMVFQAYIDESEGAGGTYALAGHVAPAKTWAKFSVEWEKLLPLTKLGPNNVRRFKFTEMVANFERFMDMSAFYRVIENNVSCSISTVFNIHDFNNAFERIVTPGAKVDWLYMRRPYFFAFRTLMDSFHNERLRIGNIIPMNEPVDFIFDDQNEKSFILKAWDDYIGSRPPELKKLYGQTPRFENDERFLPLQAADLWAGAIRMWGDSGERERVRAADFGLWFGKRDDHVRMTIECDQDTITKMLMLNLAAQLPTGAVIVDRSGRLSTLRGALP